MPQWVLLPRALNLGSRNKVNMPRLRELLADAGFADVRTYVQSGNIVARTRHRTPAAVARAAEAVIADGFGVTTSVIVRTPKQVRSLIDWCPFPDDAAQRPSTVLVIHLSAPPDPDAAAAAAAADWTPDRLAIRGLEAVISYGVATQTSRLQHAPLLKRLGVNGTARNWRTLLAIEGLL